MLVKDGGIVAVGTMSRVGAALEEQGATLNDVDVNDMQGAFLMPVRRRAVGPHQDAAGGGFRGLGFRV